MTALLMLLLPVAATASWFVGQRSGRRDQPSKHQSRLPRDYFIGLRYLINEQPDKAVDIFIKMLEVDSDTVETHLALGSLFRRRGEVDRAIRIHQNLIARPNLEKSFRIQALLELGRDYMSAGVFDRAERLFLEVVEMGEQKAPSLRRLLTIYQQEQDWEKAANIAMKLGAVTNESMEPIICHYYCELSEQAKQRGSHSEAEQYLRRAASLDRRSVRVYLLRGRYEQQAGNHKSAIKHYKRVLSEDPDYITEAIPPIVESYQALGQDQELIEFLYSCIEQQPRISVILILADIIQKVQGDNEAAEFIAEQLRRRPSLRGLHRLISLQLNYTMGLARNNLLILKELTNKLLANKPNYQCNQCGISSKTLQWQCPGCKQWNTTKAIQGVEGE